MMRGVVIGTARQDRVPAIGEEIPLGWAMGSQAFPQTYCLYGKSSSTDFFISGATAV